MNTKEKEDLYKNFAPCGLACSYCSACEYGEIALLAKKLMKLLENQDNFYVKHIVLADVVKKRKIDKEYQSFDKILNGLASVTCNGCRDNPDPWYCMPDCFIKKCVAEHNIGFCGECAEFPCKKIMEFPEDSRMYADWLERNTIIQKNGIVSYASDLKAKYK